MQARAPRFASERLKITEPSSQGASAFKHPPQVPLFGCATGMDQVGAWRGWRSLICFSYAYPSSVGGALTISRAIERRGCVEFMVFVVRLRSTAVVPRIEN